MGIGDEIMALGRAELTYHVLGQPVAICGVSGRARKHRVWENHPAVDHTSLIRMTDGPSGRPYMIKWEHTKEGTISVFNPRYKAIAGRMKLTDEEWKESLKWLPEKPFIILEPIVRKPGSQNKDWGILKWEKAFKDFPLPIYQFDPDGRTRILSFANRILSPDFRISAGIVSHAALVVTIDGGMHHIAASMGTPAVVIFGGFANPKITGYSFQKSFYADVPGSPCGRYFPCEHCRSAMDSIKPEAVREAALQILKEKLEDGTQDDSSKS